MDERLIVIAEEIIAAILYGDELLDVSERDLKNILAQLQILKTSRDMDSVGE